MNLRAWFDPTVRAEVRELLVNREVLGTWQLRPLESAPEKKLYGHIEELRLADGSALRLSATCDTSFDQPSTTLCILSGTTPLFVTTVSGTRGFEATVATGKGGFLTLRFWFDSETPSKASV